MKELLKGYDVNKVDVFIGYINQLKAEKKDGKDVNPWIKYITTDVLVTTFKKVASTGLYIDGDSVTLTFRGKLLITYDYHAYKNKVSLTYPETIFDFGLVYKDDTFSFKKESGKVIYSHVFSNPFNHKDSDLIGAYGIIKNSRGEFIELLSLEDIEKMRKTSKMPGIWNTWFDRMVLKSVIKRICSTHFKDLIKDIDVIDNELNEPARASIDTTILKLIDKADTEDQLGLIYKSNLNIVEDKASFIELLGKRKGELINGSLS